MATSKLKNNLNIADHNGTTAGLQLAGVLVTATAAELNAIDGATAGTVVASKGVVVDANKDIASFRNLTAVNLDAGADAVAGTVDVYPTTTATGKLILAAVSSAGAFNTTISNASLGQSSVVSIPDPGAATAKFVLDSGVNTMISGASLKIDSSTLALSAHAGTLSRQAGVVTTEALTTAGGASQAFVITNTKVAATSNIMITEMGGSNTVQDYKLVAVPTTNTLTVTVYNNTAATQLNGTLIFGFVVVN